MSVNSDDENISIGSQTSDDNPAADTEPSKDRSSTGGSSHGSGEGRVKFVQKESRQVLFLRIGVVLILLLAATAVSILVFVSVVKETIAK